MNSAEKKAPEPSMDDIISSIRNIIADDTQEATPVETPPAVESQAPAIVQLTENQIAEPVSAQANGVPAGSDVGDLATAPETAAIAPTSADLEIASEIDAVPGLVTAPEAPATQAAPAPGITTPNLKISEPSQPATAVAAPEIEDVMAAAAQPIEPVQVLTPAPVVEPVVAEMSAQAPAPIILDDEPAVPLEDDIAFVSPEPGQVSPTSPAADLSQGKSFAQANDPVEEMMQSVSADQAELDTVNNGVDPDQILDGMEPAVVNESAPITAPIVQEPIVEAAAPIENIAKEAPVVLDASQVTPEDAVAITAVAAATTQALSGASAPEATPDAEQAPESNSLESSVKAMLKPMIKEWLDDNMPRILEGAIKEEVDVSGSDKT